MAPSDKKQSGNLRTSDSYVSKDEEKRARQLANLKGVQAKAKKPEPEDVEPEPDLFRIQESIENSNIIEFCEVHCGITPYIGQRVALKLIYGEPLEGDDEWQTYLEFTGGAAFTDFDGEVFQPQMPREVRTQHNVGNEAEEVIVACGARGGKSTIISTVVALYESIARGNHWRKFLRDGETGYAVIVATRQDQAKDIIQKNCANIIKQSDTLKHYLAEEPKTLEISLTNGLKIISLPCNGTAGRGIPVYYFCMDEIAHFRVEGTNTGESVAESIEPRMAQFPGAKTILPSTPAAKQGLLWNMFNDGWEVPGRITIQAPSKVLNPTIPDRFLERMKRKNRDNYEREFLGRFAQRMSQFFPDAPHESCYILDDNQDPQPGVYYHCGIDQSGMSGNDNFSLSIAHQERNGAVVQDYRVSWSTEKLEQVFIHIAKLSEIYGFTTVWQDRYAAGYVASMLERYGLTGQVRPPLPIVYNNTKSLMIASKLFLIADNELRNGMLNTIAYYGKNNTMSIEHERGADGHADLADATATSVYAASIDERIHQDTYVSYDCITEELGGYFD